MYGQSFIVFKYLKFLFVMLLSILSKINKQIKKNPTNKNKMMAFYHLRSLIIMEAELKYFFLNENIAS